LGRLPLRAPGIRFEPVLEERLVVALPSGHALEGLDRVSLEVIADLPLIFFTRQLIPGFHAHYESAVSRQQGVWSMRRSHPWRTTSRYLSHR
jgi:DNA-binding transcriptional LysR family regulator